MTEKFADIINIPKERIAVLVGKNGEIRRKIEKETGVKIHIDSKSGEVEIIRGKSKDPLLELKALDIIKAIARGFAPQKAFKLLLPNIYVEIISLTEYVSDKNLNRIRARIIGKSGKAREHLSHLTDTDIVIYGKTVGIIGDEEEVNLAREAILKLIQGSSHSTVYRLLERKRTR